MQLFASVACYELPERYISKLYQPVTCDKVFMFGSIANVFCSKQPVSFVTLRQVTLDYADISAETLRGFYLEAPAISNVEYDFYSTQKYSLICFSLGRVLLQNSSIKLEGADTI